MAKLDRFTLNRSGVRELLKSQEALAACRSHADATRARLGDGYAVTTHVGKNRVNASVAAVSARAKRENLEHNSILKALR